ncbi:argininosuccinate lyase [Paludisphaera mucosa]|uniref:Argininosuccinate lyase n=1 Tax=Paludisphaera mucosa TaxID=3030827 RepID=A0ABT6FIX0_9BACT|nr:argininosuccinate lyase [Paludisphaera mucosa]
MTSKPWGGRFDAGTDRRVEEFTESISFDRRLFRHDVLGSQAHARMLAHVGLLTQPECEAIVRGLGEIQAQIEAGDFPFVLEREDVHMHIEAALTEKLGDLGRKLHTGRSRNDQVSTDVKLWTRDAIDRLAAGLVHLQRAFVASAGRHEGLILPGYTHMQRAQPVLAPHYFLAYVEKLERDRSRLADCRRRLNVLPLGAAALAGTSIPIDREFTARELGFDGVAANSLDVSSDRDFAIEAVFALTLIAEHLAGWAEEWILWSTQEFGFLKLPDAICTGSSIMPQKKNPDVLELIRGRSARVIGSLTTLLVLIKGLPLAYNRDLQEDKIPLFDAFDTVEACVELAAVVVSGASLRPERIAERLDEGFLDATTLMEHLILNGVPQRTAHEVIGRLVGLCERKGLKRLADLADADLAEASPKLGPESRGLLGVEAAIRAFKSYGSTAPAEVAGQVERWKTKLEL